MTLRRFSGGKYKWKDRFLGQIKGKKFISHRRYSNERGETQYYKKGGGFGFNRKLAKKLKRNPNVDWLVIIYHKKTKGRKLFKIKTENIPMHQTMNHEEPQIWITEEQFDKVKDYGSSDNKRGTVKLYCKYCGRRIDSLGKPKQCPYCNRRLG